MEQLTIAQLDRWVWYWVSAQRHVVSVVEHAVLVMSFCSQWSYSDC